MHSFSATADRRPHAARAFTLLEVLLSLAIIGLLAAVLIGGSAQLLNSKPSSITDVFWQAVQEARKDALRHEREVYLKYYDELDKGKGFAVVDGTETKTFPLPPSSLTPDLMVNLLMNQGGGNLLVLGGVVVEANPAKFVTFYSDGTCQGFKLQVMRAGSASSYAIDPWTCAPMLVSDPNAPKS